MKEKADKIIIGAGLYGLYAALHCGKKKEKIVVLECDHEPFGRACIRDIIIPDPFLRP